MTIEQMCERKKELGYSYEQISELSGLPVSTVQKVLGGYTKSPRYDTLRALEDVLGEKNEFLVKEASPYGQTVKRQGEYTLEDYYKMPDDVRIELIDGVIYYMDAPSMPHQHFCGELYAQFREVIKKNGGRCMPFVSPIDVQLDCDDKTMVQPDVIIVCDRDKLNYKCVYGAPDFVVEVLSPSTKRKDHITKMSKYAAAGVREYWIIDINRQMVYVYEFEKEEAPFVAIYTFDDEVPVGIYDGKCTIKFADIYEQVKFLYEE